MNDEIKYNETANINFKEIATVSEEFINIKAEDEGMIGVEDEIYRDYQGKKFDWEWVIVTYLDRRPLISDLENQVKN